MKHNTIGISTFAKLWNNKKNFQFQKSIPQWRSQEQHGKKVNQTSVNFENKLDFNEPFPYVCCVTTRSQASHPPKSHGTDLVWPREATGVGCRVRTGSAPSEMASPAAAAAPRDAGVGDERVADAAPGGHRTAEHARREDQSLSHGFNL